jgi:hypothetical protein
LIASPALPAYTDANLANGFYEYQVYAVYAGGISEPTRLVQALVEVLYPPELSHQVLDRNDVSLSWQMPLSTEGLRPFVSISFIAMTHFWCRLQIRGISMLIWQMVTIIIMW